MMTFLKIAWRNITRSKSRSCITISAVGFGVGALIFIWGFVEGAHRQMIENYTSLLTSDIQIHQKGFHQSQKLETHLLNPETLLVALEKNAQIKANAPRIKAVGLVSSSKSSSCRRLWTAVSLPAPLSSKGFSTRERKKSTKDLPSSHCAPRKNYLSCPGPSPR